MGKKDKIALKNKKNRKTVKDITHFKYKSHFHVLNFLSSGILHKVSVNKKYLNSYKLVSVMQTDLIKFSKEL